MNPPGFDLICFSHLRWGFVFQRPQHLMSRFAAMGRVFYFEEPVFEAGVKPHLSTTRCSQTGVTVCVPVLSVGAEAAAEQKRLLQRLLRERKVENYAAWYYTPMACEFTQELEPVATIYDCMDELSGFLGAPPALRANELRLFQKADLVFTGGASLFAAKRAQHTSVHLFPSSVDCRHFMQARQPIPEPAEQASIARPRLGYAGVIDERMDLELIREVAALRPDWQFVMLGPVVKIDPATLPRAANIHYLGMKDYADLPAYFAGWEIGLLPFALNDATRFISPTKTPEYLAAGLPVISTPIRDVVSPYGEQGLAGIAGDAGEFVQIAESYLRVEHTADFRLQVDEFLAGSSWDDTWSRMHQLVTGIAVQGLAHV